ncbi:MAG: TauD/TfdA family dioxygenase [Betaproteobacteria bacterium]|nr:MAG: TauD/TfdA family dioxygenase [Betaproteobacteria bacterium]
MEVWSAGFPRTAIDARAARRVRAAIRSARAEHQFLSGRRQTGAHRRANLRRLQPGPQQRDTEGGRPQTVVRPLYARSVAPIGGHTEFADMRAAWDALPQETRRHIDGLVVEHSIFHSRAKLGFTDYSERERAALPPAQQVLVRTIPETGRRSLYIASHARRVIGIPDEEGRGLLDSLMAHATQRQFVYTHRWRLHDLVMWDNRCTMHRGTEFEEQRWKRDMQRATVSDIGNTCELVNRRAATSAV